MKFETAKLDSESSVDLGAATVRGFIRNPRWESEHTTESGAGGF